LYPNVTEREPEQCEKMFRAGPDLPIGYIGLSLGPQDPRGPQKTVVRIESMTGI